MIIKSYEINKIKNKKFSFFLFYGKNQGLKAEAINELLKDEVSILKYDENEVLEKSSEFYDSLLSKSLFGEKKNIIIKRATDKIIKLLIEYKNEISIISSSNYKEKYKEWMSSVCHGFVTKIPSSKKSMVPVTFKHQN